MIPAREENSNADHQMPSWRDVFLYFLFLGFVNIGGPVAQITMMFNHMVEKRRWLSKDRFIKIMAFCHMLPGPEALQLAIYVGYLKRKLWGGVLAGVTFIVPGAIAMMLIATMTAALVTNSGRSAWFVGVLVVNVYLVFAMTLYLLPPQAN